MDSTITWQAHNLPNQDFYITCDLGQFLVRVKPGAFQIGDSFQLNAEGTATWLWQNQAKLCSALD